MATKSELTRRMTSVLKPFLEKGEKLMRAADSLKGPKTIYASFLTPVGFFIAERPRYVGLTSHRLLVVIPPARRGAEARLDMEAPRQDVDVVAFEQGRLWTRIVVGIEGRSVGLNFARIWRPEAEFIHRKLETKKKRRS
jgi:hypothetical protein